MALFTRGGSNPEAVPIDGHADLALVAEMDAEEMVDYLATETFEHVDEDEIAPGLSRALAIGLFEVTDLDGATNETTVAARWIARVGYMARVAERERVPAARKPRGWMIIGLRGAVESSLTEELADADTEESFYEALAEVTAFFVRREPLDLPYDADEGFKPMWTIPGMGGDFRALLREETLAMVLEDDGEELRGPFGTIRGATYEDLQLVWKYGFLLRAFEEFFSEG
jgi:hypothetical protein